MKSLSSRTRSTWMGVLRTLVPEGVQIIPLTWVFKIKQLPNGDVDKFKARICVRGDLQIVKGGIYAPVVKWPTIWSVLAFAIKHNLKSCQIDFTNAFIQGELPKGKEIHVKLPGGFSHQGEDTVLKLNKG